MDYPNGKNYFKNVLQKKSYTAVTTQRNKLIINVFSGDSKVTAV